MTKRLASLCLLIASAAFAQSSQSTLFNLQTQSRNPDFSNFPFTRPVTVGATLPATCQVGQLFYNSTAVAGANLYACTAVNVWNVEGGGAGMAAQLNDFGAVLSGGTVTVGAGCSPATPCNVRFGNTVRAFTSAATLTISGSGSGSVFIYIDSSGNLTAGSIVPLSCTACSFVAGLTSFPAGSIPLYSWTVASGSFSPSGRTDERSWLATKNLVAGSGIMVVESAGTSTISVDTSVISTYVATAPVNSNASCSAGQFSTDSTFFYVCVGPHTWRRLALGAF